MKHCFKSLVTQAILFQIQWNTEHIVSNMVQTMLNHCFNRGGKRPQRGWGMNEIVINGHIVDLDTCQHIATRHNVDGDVIFTDHLLRAGAGKYILHKIRPLTRTEIKYILLDNLSLLVWLNGLPTRYIDIEALVEDGIIKRLAKVVPAPTHAPTSPQSGGGGDC